MSRSYQRLAGLLAAGIALPMILAGCALENVPEPPDNQSATESPLPGVDEERLDVVLERFAATLEAADKARSPEQLATEVTGPALIARSAEYVLAEKNADFTLPEILTTNQVSSTEARLGFPRTALVITDPQDKALEQLLLFTQKDARANYQLSAYVTFFPAVTVPSLMTLAVGSEPNDSDANLLLKRESVIPRFLDQVHNPEGENEDLFSANPLTNALREKLEAYQKAVAEVGEAEMGLVAGDPEDMIVLSTADGGALMTGTFQSRLTIKRTVAGSTINLSDQIASLLGNGEVIGSVTGEFFHIVTFYVPPVGSDLEQVRVLGATSVLVDARRDDSLAPQNGEDG